jgi:peptide deformylase
MTKTLETIHFGNPILRKVAELLTPEEIRSQSTQDLIESMLFTLQQKEYGVGLSAPQVGVGVAISVIAIKPTPTLPDLAPLKAVLINPSVVETFGEKKNMIEGCISAGVSGDSICAKVPRTNQVRIKWLDEYAVEHDEIFEGFAAHTVQHEIDHLNGILFVDRVEDTKTYCLMSEFTKQSMLAKK